MTTNKVISSRAEDIRDRLAAGTERQVPRRRKRTGTMATVRLHKRNKLLTKRKDKPQRGETVSCEE